MRRGTDAFEEARNNRDPVYVRVDVLTGGELVASTEARSVSKIAVVNSPTLSQDAGASIVTAINTLQLVISDDLVPADAFAVFSPLNDTEFWISTGFVVDGQPETQPAAVMSLENARFENHGDGRQVYCDLFDRAKKLERAQFVWPRAVAAGANIPETIEEFLREVYPEMKLVAPAIGTPAAAMEISDTENRLSAINKLAASIGFTFAFDNVGQPHLYPPPLPDSEAAEHYSTVSNEHGKLLSVCRTLTRDGVYNGVILKATSTRQSEDQTGETPDPLYAEAWADNVLTPLTYTQAEADRRAPGAFPLISTSQILTNQAEVDIAARAAADLVGLQPESVSISVTPNPGLELFDVVAIDDPLTGTTGTFTVTVLSRPLGSDGFLGIGCSERRIA